VLNLDDMLSHRVEAVPPRTPFPSPVARPRSLQVRTRQ